MRVSPKLVLAAVSWAAAGGPAPGADWAFQTPPSSLYRVPVDADWRGYARVELDVHVEQVSADAALLCSFYFQNKQDQWVRSRRDWRLSGRPRTIRLSLAELSPDWHCATARRPFGKDLLRWVRAWGIEVFCAEPVSATLKVGALRLAPEPAPAAVSVTELRLPHGAAAGGPAPLTFRLEPAPRNPYNSEQAAAALVWRCGGRTGVVPAYCRQDFVSLLPPGRDRPRLEPLERPYWCADWRPPVAGSYALRLRLTADGRRREMALGTLSVDAPRKAAGNGRVRAAGAIGYGDRLARSPLLDLSRSVSGRITEFREHGWIEADEPPCTLPYWSAVLDWTPEWGHYTGSGELEQRLAWRLEEELLRYDAEQARPLLLFDEDALDNRGLLNWRDHPLNRAQGGPLARPFDLFRDPRARRVLLDRARYLWARYGHLPSVNGLLILVRHPEQDALRCVREIAAELTRDFPELRLLCNNPELLERWRRRDLELARFWRVDRSLTEAASAELAVGEGRVALRCIAPRTVGLVARYPQHWAAAQAFSCDIGTSSHPEHALKVLCLLRTDADTVYQSRLNELRPDDVNRILFRLDRERDWQCLQDPERKLTPGDLLNIREIGLRFFHDASVDADLQISNCALHWPYRADVARRPPLKIELLEPAPPTVPRYGRLELRFALNRVFNNPYDPEEIDATLQLTDPSGAQLRHPAFYCEPWRLSVNRGRERAAREGDAHWRVRFTPWRQGEYRWKLVARSAGESASAGGSFLCTPSGKPGFVTAAAGDPRAFEFSSGEFYYPIGYNLRSPGDERMAGISPDAVAGGRRARDLGTAAYARWFRRMEEQGANFARVWMSPWWCGLEWNQDHAGYHGAGYYNQANAARLDRILELADQHGIRLCLETVNHGCLSSRVDADWQNNPMNRTLPGGFLEHATDFFSDPRAQALHRNKLRYTVARWGYSPAIAWWGTMTEAEWVEPYTRSLYRFAARRSVDQPLGPKPYNTSRYREPYLRWLSRTGGFIASTDAHPHLVSVHFSNPDNGTDIWERPHTDVVHNNAYTLFSEFWRQQDFRQSRGVADMMYVFAEVYRRYSRAKPLLVGEWGGQPTRNDEQQLVAELHTGLWAMLMTEASGATGYWWWNLLDARDLYGHFGAVSAFMKGEDRRGKRYRSSRAAVAFEPAETRQGPFRRDALVLAGGHELFGYVYCRAINRRAGSWSAGGFDDPRFPPSGTGRLALPDRFTNGDYRVEYWDTFAGRPIGSRDIVVDDHHRTVPLPSHRVDLALKVKPR